MSNTWSGAHSVLERGFKGLTLEDVSPETRVIINTLDFDRGGTHPLVMPIYHSSTYVAESVQQFVDNERKGGFIYQREGNPTRSEAECAVKAYEGGALSLLFSSGMAAVTSALGAFLKSGDHVVCQNPIYPGTSRWLDTYGSGYNIEVSYVPAGCAVEEFKKHIKPNTKMIIGETPCNPMMTILDLEEFGKLGHDHDNIVTLVDSTFGSPYLQQPIKYGIDIVAHSCTKYIGGHSDILAGVLTTRTGELGEKIYAYRTSVGNALSPFEASLLARGLKTLSLRMDRHSYNAQKLAEYLHVHSMVAKVNYPGLKSHPAHDLARKQMLSFGGMISFEMKSQEAAKTLAENCRIIVLAVSLGGVESLIEVPDLMTHPGEGIAPGLIRLSVGTEDVNDLIKDLEQAMEKVKG